MIVCLWKKSQLLSTLAVEIRGRSFRVACTHFPYVSLHRRSMFFISTTGTFTIHPTSELSNLSNSSYSTEHFLLPCHRSHYLIRWRVQHISRSHYHKTSTRRYSWMRIRARDTICCTSVLAFLIILLVILLFHSRTKCKTEVNSGLSLSAILKEIPPSSQIFAGVDGTHSHATASFCSQNGSRAVDLVQQ